MKSVQFSDLDKEEVDENALMDFIDKDESPSYVQGEIKSFDQMF